VQPHVAPAAITHLGSEEDTTESASTLGDFKPTRKQQSCHKIMVGNWNIASLTGKEHELVEEAKRSFWETIG